MSGPAAAGAGAAISVTSSDEASYAPRPVPRLVSLPAAGALFGFAGGLYSGSSKASLQYRAENAHRTPRDRAGWYFYHKTKNYRVLWAGIKGGLKMGTRTALWVGAFAGLEEVVRSARRRYAGLVVDAWGYDALRGVGGKAKGRTVEGRAGEEVDTGRFIDGALAGVGTGIGAASLYRLPRQTSYRALLIGLVAGGLAGGLEDLRDSVRAAKDAEERRKAADMARTAEKEREKEARERKQEREQLPAEVPIPEKTQTPTTAGRRSSKGWLSMFGL